MHLHTWAVQEASALLKKLAHPMEQPSLEEQLAQSMPIEWDKAYVKQGNAVTQWLFSMAVSDIEKPWNMSWIAPGFC